MNTISDELIRSIYDASIEPHRWPAALTRIADAYDASVGVLFCHDHLYPDKDIQVHVRNPDDIQQIYQENYFIEGDIWYQIARANWPRHSVVVGHEHISDGELRKTGFYNDILKPSDCGQQLSGSIMADDRHTRAIALSRPLNGKRFNAADKHSMSALVEHLNRAFRIHEKLAGVGKQNNLTERMMSMTSLAAMVCTSSGKILFANTLAEKVLEKADGLTVLNQRLCACNEIKSAEIKFNLKNIQQIGSALINIDRKDNVNPYQFIAFQIDKHKQEFASDETLVGILISNPENISLVDEGLLIQWFGLTKAEAFTVHLLYQGLSPAEIAAHKDIKISTVRTQLHRVFEKTNCRNQAQLIRQIAETLMWHGIRHSLY